MGGEITKREWERKKWEGEVLGVEIELEEAAADKQASENGRRDAEDDGPVEEEVDGVEASPAWYPQLNQLHRRFLLPGKEKGESDRGGEEEGQRRHRDLPSHPILQPLPLLHVAAHHHTPNPGAHRRRSRPVLLLSFIYLRLGGG